MGFRTNSNSFAKRYGGELSARTMDGVDDVRAEPQTPERAAEHWWVLAGAATGPVGLLAMRWLFTPAPEGVGTHEQLGLPPCRSLDWFGIPCPGCGVTTSVTWFAHGEPWTSFTVQPFGFALAAFALLALPVALVAAARGTDLGYAVRRIRLMRWWIGASVAVGASWIYKIAITV